MQVCGRYFLNERQHGSRMSLLARMLPRLERGAPETAPDATARGRCRRRLGRLLREGLLRVSGECFYEETLKTRKEENNFSFLEERLFSSFLLLPCRYVGDTS